MVFLVVVFIRKNTNQEIKSTLGSQGTSQAADLEDLHVKSSDHSYITTQNRHDSEGLDGLGSMSRVLKMSLWAGTGIKWSSSPRMRRSLILSGCLGEKEADQCKSQWEAMKMGGAEVKQGHAS